jgi:hypothetical protein
MLYGSKCWAVDRRIEHIINIAEKRMLRWISGITRDDRIRNEYVIVLV